MVIQSASGKMYSRFPNETEQEMAKVLLVEDDDELSEVLKHTLVSRGFTVQSVKDGNSAMDLLKVNHYDVIVLDWMMPGLSGIDVCKRLRSSGNKCPILMLTARTTDDDIEEGLDAGADDYLAKPFEDKVLAARLRALLRRPPVCAEPVLTAGNISWDPARNAAFRDGKELYMRPMVAKLFEFFLRHPAQFFTADALLERVWHDESLATHETVRAHVKLLRKVIDLPGQPSLIETERNRGYRLTTSK